MTLSEIADEQFVAYSSNYWASLNKELQASRALLVMTDRENLKRLVSEGRAVALMPETFALFFAITKRFKPKMPINGKDFFQEAYDKLGRISGDGKRALVIVALILAFLLTANLHKIDVMWGFAFSFRCLCTCQGSRSQLPMTSKKSTGAWLSLLLVVFLLAPLAGR